MYVHMYVCIHVTLWCNYLFANNNNDSTYIHNYVSDCAKSVQYIANYVEIQLSYM